MVTAQFAEPLPNFNIIELGRLAERFLEEFPTFNQINPAGPMPTNIAQLTGLEEMRAPVANFPRLKFDTLDGQFTLLIQQDRLSISWQRSPDENGKSVYPGFEDILKTLMRSIDNLNSHVDQDIVPFAGEIAYSNFFETSSENGKIKLSSIFSLIEAVEDPIHMNGFTFSWNEILDEENGAIQVSIGAPSISPTPESFVLLELTGIKAFSQDAADMPRNFLDLRSSLRESFRRIVNASFRGEGNF